MATSTTEFIDATTADAYIGEVWSKKAIVARENQLIFAGLVRTDFDDEADWGDTIHIGSVGNLSVQSKDRSANAATIYETVTETNLDIVMSSWEYSAIAIETATKRQATQDLMAKYAPKQGYALALSIDDALAALPDNFTNPVGTLAVELTYDDALRARQYLDDADVPNEDRAWAISPAQEAGFLKLDQFVHADYGRLQGTTTKAMDRAMVGSWLGVPVYKSVNVEGSNAAGHDNALLHKEAIALVRQMRATTHSFFDVDYLAFKAVVEQLYGVKELRDDHGVWAKGA